MCSLYKVGHVDSYHDADNVMYDCWPLDANTSTSNNVVDCAGQLILKSSCFYIPHVLQI